MTYSFKEQLAKGAVGENLIRSHFKADWLITPSTMTDQRRGIDFHFQHRQSGIHCTVELKSDTKASETGNAFVETYSVYPDKKGWAYTCQADYLFYFLPKDRVIYIFKPDKFRSHLERWEKYPTRSIPNRGWETRGILVPLHEFEKHAKQVLSI